MRTSLDGFLPAAGPVQRLLQPPVPVVQAEPRRRVLAGLPAEPPPQGRGPQPGRQIAAASPADTDVLEWNIGAWSSRNMPSSSIHDVLP